MTKLVEKWILNPQKRYHFFAWLSVGMIFLIPFLGWSPLLLIWIIHSYLSDQEQKHSKVRFLHALLGLTFLILFICNVCMRVIAVFQCFGI